MGVRNDNRVQSAVTEEVASRLNIDGKWFARPGGRTLAAEQSRIEFFDVIQIAIAKVNKNRPPISQLEKFLAQVMLC